MKVMIRTYGMSIVVAYTTLFEEYENIRLEKIRAANKSAETRRSRLQNWVKELQERYGPDDRRLTNAESRAKGVHDWLGRDFPKLLALTLVMNNVVNLGGLTLVGVAVEKSEEGAFLAFIMTTVCVIVFGEITAKSIAQKFPVHVATCTIYLVNGCNVVFGWFTNGLVRPVEVLTDRLSGSSATRVDM